MEFWRVLAVKFWDTYLFDRGVAVYWALYPKSVIRLQYPLGVGPNSEAYSDNRECKGVEVTLMFRVSCFSCYQDIRGKRTITLR